MSIEQKTIQSPVDQYQQAVIDRILERRYKPTEVIPPSREVRDPHFVALIRSQVPIDKLDSIVISATTRTSR